MKKAILSLAIIAIASLSANAQKEKMESKDLSFSVGVEAALPLGTFGDVYSFGIGGSVQGDYNVAENFAITLNAGYLSFSGKSTTINFGTGNVTYKPKALGYIPVLVGGKYHFTPQVYGSAQLGLTFASGSGSGSAFTYAPGIGFNFTPQFDALLKYEGWSKSGTSQSAVGLRVAYYF